MLGLGQSWTKSCAMRTCCAAYEFTILPFKDGRFLWSNMSYSLVLTLPQLFVPNEFPKHLPELDALFFWKHFKLIKIRCLNVVVEEKVLQTQSSEKGASDLVDIYNTNLSTLLT